MNTGVHRHDPKFLASENVEALLATVDAKPELWRHMASAGPDVGAYWRQLPLVVDTKRTEAFQYFAALDEILNRLECPVYEVDLFSMLPGGQLYPHRDLRGTLELGRLRPHLPLATNSAAEFLFDGLTVTMASGELWALNTSHLHAAANRGTTDRIHLVLEVGVNSWLKKQLPARRAGYYLNAVTFFAHVTLQGLKTVLYEPSKLGPHLRLARIAARFLVGRHEGADGRAR